MLFVKYLGCIMMIISTTAVGFFCSSTLNQRRIFLAEFLVFLNTLKTYIRFNSAEIHELVSSCAVSDILFCFKEIPKPKNGESFYSLWGKAVKSIHKNIGLTKEDKKLLMDFGAELGSTDIEGQLNHIEMYYTLFQMACKDAVENVAKKSKLYKMLGLFSGMAVSLIII